MSPYQSRIDTSPQKVFVANRGEIAVRICRSIFECGWTSVAAVARGDARDGYASRADEMVELPGFGAAAFLDPIALTAAARHAECTLVHPGYGFLSESPAFAKKCAEAGLIFVGPSPHCLEVFGVKSSARSVAKDCGVAVPEGSVILADAAALAEFQRDVGRAVMLKSVAGGGGRGIRVVRSVVEAEDAFARCRSEAEAAFGDGRLYAERLIQGARHIEIQAVGDGTGDVSILGERDCSLQRRRQKVLEFAPAAGLAARTRSALYDAARRIVAKVDYLGLATVEFLVAGEEIFFLEVNPRLQVEHTVTEALTGVDLVAVQLRLALGARLGDLGLPPEARARGCALQLRINTETMLPDGTVKPSSGRVTAFDMPYGPGLRIDTEAGPGHEVTPAYDSLLAKLIVHEPEGNRDRLLRRAYRALCECNIRGVETNLHMLQNLLRHEAVLQDTIDTEFLDRHVSELVVEDALHPRYGGARGVAAPVAAEQTGADIPDGHAAVRADTDARVVELSVSEGDIVQPGQMLGVLEAMKMEFPVQSPVGGTVRTLEAQPGAAVRKGAVLAVIARDDLLGDAVETEEAQDLESIRADLRRVLDARLGLTDQARPEAVAKRRKTGQRTARENIADLCDDGSFHEYGGFALAAQRGRRDLDTLRATSPADGMVMGFGTVNAKMFGAGRAGCAVLAYDYTVFAGTQGVNAHIKKNRLFRLVEKYDLPLVMFAEGGGGRPGDTDDHGFLKLYNPTFYAAAKLKSKVPVLAIVSGNCFAGNAALAACADVIIATRNASIGMGGPTMISGGGLGEVAAADVGPMSTHGPNGVVDLIVEDEAEAVAVAKAILSCVQGPLPPGPQPDPRRMRHVIPEAPRRAYRMREVIESIVDTGSFIELRADYGVGVLTGFARIGGQPFAILANNPAHLVGALDAAGASKAADFATLVEKLGLPLLKLVDTPGFMVGPLAESEGLVRQAGRMFAAGAVLTVPQFTIVVRKAYGLGALAMVSGNAHEQVMTVAWPSGHFGKMGLEGHVRLAYRRELEALPGEAEREAKLRAMIVTLHEQGHPINAAAYLSIDEVIDPIDTRDWLLSGLAFARRSGATGKTNDGREMEWDH